MEAWRQWQLGRRKNLVQRKTKRILLTPTGLLMEDVYTQNSVAGQVRAFPRTVQGLPRYAKNEPEKTGRPEAFSEVLGGS